MLNNYSKADAAVIFFISITVAAFFILTGTLFSGFHFTDDHELIRINNDFNKSSFFSVLGEWTMNDFSIRFRPLYYIHRVILVRIFGLNFMIWSIYFLVMLIATLSLFYLALRKLKMPIIVSLLFPLIAVAGTQAENWWRLGTCENAGAFFLAISFYYLKYNAQKNTAHSFLFGLSLIAAALFKESFILIIPAMLLLKILVYQQEQQSTYRKIVTDNILLVLPLLCSLIFIYIIYAKIGTNKIGYAGVEEGASIAALVPQIKTLLKNELYYYWILLLTGVLFTLFAVKDDQELLQYFKKLGGLLLFLIAFLAPLLVLYAKSGMSDRYMIPATIGIAYFFAELIKKTGSKFSWQSICLFLAAGWIFYIQSDKTVAAAKKFTLEGNNIKSLIQSIVTRAKPNSYIVLAFDPVASNEAAFSLKTYLESVYNIHLYGAFIERNSVFSSPELSKVLLSNANLWFKDHFYKPENGKEPDIIVFINKGMRTYFFDEGSSVSSESYKNTITPESPHCIYYK